jgi:hypothetical protein
MMNGTAFGIICLVAILAIGLGLALSNSDVLNPTTSAADAFKAKQDAEIQAQKATIELDKAAFDLANYKAVGTARTKAEQEKLGLEVQARQHELDQALAQQRAQAEQDLALARLTRYAMLAAGTLAILVVSVGLTTCLIQFSRSRLATTREHAPVEVQATVTTPALAVHAESWHDPAWRTEQVKGARTIEFIEHQSALIWQAPRKTVIGGDGDHSRAESGKITRLPVAHDRPAKTASAN